MKGILIVFVLILSLGACKNHSHSHDTEGTTENTEEMKGKEYTSAYICPMHCKGSGSDQAGVCPECGMDYVENKNAGHNHDGHDHDHDHEGHDHEGHDH